MTANICMQTGEAKELFNCFFKRTEEPPNKKASLKIYWSVLCWNRRKKMKKECGTKFTILLFAFFYLVTGLIFRGTQRKQSKHQLSWASTITWQFLFANTDFKRFKVTIWCNTDSCLLFSYADCPNKSIILEKVLHWRPAKNHWDLD